MRKIVLSVLAIALIAGTAPQAFAAQPHRHARKETARQRAIPQCPQRRRADVATELAIFGLVGTGGPLTFVSA